MSSDPPVVRLEHVSKEYRVSQERSNLRGLIPGRRGELAPDYIFRAVDDVTFEVGPGEVLGIMGPNGSGKSTILKMIAGIVEPTRGQVSARGRLAALIELGVGFNADLTGRENIFFASSLMGMSHAETRRRFDEIVEFSGIGEFLDMPVKRYSTGMWARLGFAVATASRPDLVLVDENLSVGDYAFQVRSLERIANLREEGTTLIVVSHSNWLLNQLCDRAILLERGRVVIESGPSEVISRYVGQTSMEDEELEAVPVFEDYEDVDEDDPAAVIESIEAVPPIIEPRDPVTIRATIDVKRPIDGMVVMSLFTSDRAVFAEREPGPSDFLQRPGRWTVEARLRTVPLGTGRFQFRMAVLPEDDRDPHQAFRHAVCTGQAEVVIKGGLSGRPGILLDHEWVTEQQ